MPSCSRMVVCSISTGRSCSLSVAFLARVSSAPSSRFAIVPLSLSSSLLVGAPSGHLPATVLDSRCPNNTKKSTEIIILAYLTNAVLIGGSRTFASSRPYSSRDFALCDDGESLRQSCHITTPSRQERAHRVRLSISPSAFRSHLEQNLGAIEIPCKRPRYCITI